MRALPHVRVVLFDIYGTLLISASGDIASSVGVVQGDAFRAAITAAGGEFQGDGEAGVQMLLDEIVTDHARSRRAGVEHPEVDIMEIWQRAVAKLIASGQLKGNYPGAEDTSHDRLDLPDLDLPDLDLPNLGLRRLALEYEMRINPVWPMPHARECLERLHCAGFVLGVISNAQFFTIELCRALLQLDASSFEFDKELQYYSYQHRRAKPGRDLYELAAETLARRGVLAPSVLYVGNDMLNDVMPAQSVGFRTALFAGDARSLRWRADDQRVAGLAPDIVITSLLDILSCIG